MGMEWEHFVVPANSRAWGLILMWKTDLNVQILFSDSWCIHAGFNDYDNEFVWFFLWNIG